MRRAAVTAILFLALATGVTVSAKTVQERRAERLLRSQSFSSLTLSRGNFSSISSPGAPIPKSFALSPEPAPRSPQGDEGSFSIPILVYHHIRPTARYGKETWSWKMSVTPEVFSRQMQWLDDYDYTPVSMATLAAIMRGEILGPVKPVVITFDDVNSSQIDAGLPVLERHHFVATFYIVLKWLDSGSHFSTQQVKDLAAKGMDIESHTMTHEWLTSLAPKDMDRELAESRKELEALTGKPVTSVAYPSTMQNATVRQRAAADGYVTGTIMDPRNATQKDDPFKLPRIMMTDETNLKKVLP